MSPSESSLPSQSTRSHIAWSIGGTFQAFLLSAWAYRHDDDLLPTVPLIIVVATLIGWLVGSQAQRFLPRQRWAALAGVILLYLLVGVALGIFWDDEFFQIMWQFVPGPLGFFRTVSALPSGTPEVGTIGNAAIIVIFLTAPTLLLASASLILRNGLGIALSALGVALWILLGFGALLNGMSY